MKIINTTRPVQAHELKMFLDEKLNPLFKKQRQIALQFDIEELGNSIEIQNTENYDGFLFKIEINGNEIHVMKSEHYTDDVNVLTLEDIMNNLFMEFPGRGEISNIEDES